MPPVNRNQPVRAASSESSYSLMEFMREFPDDATCLDWLWRTRHSIDGEHAYCPRCKADRTFKRYDVATRRQSWDCTTCGLHLHPTAGTTFAKSSTSLHLWFYAMFLMTSTRCGISAKQLERELGVTYKTAWRMMKLIRTDLMVQDTTLLQGEVEADETFIGGKPRQGKPMTRKEHLDRKKVVVGAVERGGRVRATVAEFRSDAHSYVREFVLPASTVYTDEYTGYKGTERFFTHKRINHSEKVYVSGAVHTQTIDGFWALLKNGLQGTYHSVSAKHLQSYISEYAWRYNHRDDARAMFRTLVLRAATA